MDPSGAIAGGGVAVAAGHWNGRSQPILSISTDHSADQLQFVRHGLNCPHDVDDLVIGISQNRGGHLVMMINVRCGRPISHRRPNGLIRQVSPVVVIAIDRHGVARWADTLSPSLHPPRGHPR